MDAGANEFFLSPIDVINSMPYQLSWSTPEESGVSVFWSVQNNELRRILGSLSPSVNIPGNPITTERIKVVLQSLLYPCRWDRLIQFWAPVWIGGMIYLTTAYQPFGLNKFDKKLCSYRRFCASNILLPIDGNLSPLARVFWYGHPEFRNDVSYYLSKEYPQRDYAINLGIQSYLAFPLFELFGRQKVGVIEILSTTPAYDSFYEVCFFDSKLEKMNLTSHVRLPLNRLTDFGGINKAYEAMTDICRSHQLPYAQLWTTSSTTRCIHLISHCLGNARDWKALNGDFGVFSMWGSKGVVEKAFSSRSACFCSNVTELSITVYPCVPNARKFGLASCFAICLQSTQIDDEFYILEFFLPNGGIYNGDPRNFLRMLVAMMKTKIETSLGAHVQKLGEKLFVEVIRTSSDDELDSFEICATTRTGSTHWDFKHPKGRDMMQHDYPLTDLRINNSAEQNDVVSPSAWPKFPQNSLLQQPVTEPDAGNKERNISTGVRSYISINDFGSLAKRSTASKVLDQGGNSAAPTQSDVSRSPPMIEYSRFRGVMQPDSSCQESVRVPDHISRGNLVSVDRDASAGAMKQGQENVSAKQNIDARSGPHSLPQQSVAVGDINGKRVVRIDDASCSRKQSKVWTLDREYGISREVLEQHSEKKLHDVAVILGVSRSTLKRICRRHDIYRWPPCKAKRLRLSVNPQVSIHATHERQIEERSLTNQSLSDLPQESVSVSEPHTIRNAIEEQDSGSIMVKARYRDDMIKFPLPLSSGKVNLEEEVAMRLNLSIGSFKIKYLDEDEDWIVVTCDADLRTCISTLRSLGQTTIKMQVCYIF